MGRKLSRKQLRDMANSNPVQPVARHAAVHPDDGAHHSSFSPPQIPDQTVQGIPTTITRFLIYANQVAKELSGFLLGFGVFGIVSTFSIMAASIAGDDAGAYATLGGLCGLLSGVCIYLLIFKIVTAFVFGLSAIATWLSDDYQATFEQREQEDE